MTADDDTLVLPVLEPPPSRNKWLYIFVALAALTLLAGGVMTAVSFFSPRQPAVLATASPSAQKAESLPESTQDQTEPPAEPEPSPETEELAEATPTPEPDEETPEPPDAVRIPLDDLCRWAYGDAATGDWQGEKYSIQCLGADGKSLGDMADNSGHSLNDWCADPAHTKGNPKLIQAKNDSDTADNWFCVAM